MKRNHILKNSMVFITLSIYVVSFSVFVLNNIGCAPCVATAIGATVAMSQDRRTAGKIIDDQTITAKAKYNLNKDKDLQKNSSISVISFNNSVLLLGQTTDQIMKQRAEELVSNINGVNVLYNQIDVEKPVSFSTRTKDSWITSLIKTKLISNKEIGMGKVKVMTENSKVYLMGIVSEKESKLATDLASTVQGVKEVITIFDKTNKI